MPSCVVCGYETPEGFKFCPECGTAAATGNSEHRRVVTVLFCDIVGSTALGESTEPEALRVLLARYFERMKSIVERHGGTVEKFIGDSVMAVFGVPLAHEDDALRAVRAAAEMLAALPEFGVLTRSLPCAMPVTRRVRYAEHHPSEPERTPGVPTVPMARLQSCLTSILPERPPRSRATPL
jgi:hypothetical protein